MLTITSSAVDLVNDYREKQGVPAHFGLRVSPRLNGQGSTVQLAFTEAPEDGDEIAESEGTQLFVDPIIAPEVSDAVIDTESTPAGTMLVFRGPRPA